jgi:hypothetical protein
MTHAASVLAFAKQHDVSRRDRVRDQAGGEAAAPRRVFTQEKIGPVKGPE